MASVDPSLLNQEEEIKPSAKVDLLHSGQNVPGNGQSASPLTPPTLPSQNQPLSPVGPPPVTPPTAKLQMPDMTDLGVQPGQPSSQPGRPGTLSSINPPGMRPPEAEAPRQEFPQPSSRRRTVMIISIVAVALLVIGGGGFAYYRYRQAHTAQPVQQTAPTPTPISQIQPQQLDQTAGSNSIKVGGATNQKSITFEFEVPTGVHAQQLVPQVEVESVGKPFTNTPTTTGQPVDVTGSSQTFSVTVSNISDGGYHWQASFSQQNQTGPWVAFGNGQSADFTVKTTAPSTPTVTKVGNSSFAGANNTTATTSNQPVITGHADPGTTVTLAVQPDQLSYNATADQSGNWTISPTGQIPNGSHTVTVTSTDAAGNTSQLTFGLSINPATSSSPSTSKTLAPTGDDTLDVDLAAAGVFVAALSWLLWTRRRGWR